MYLLTFYDLQGSISFNSYTFIQVLKDIESMYLNCEYYGIKLQGFKFELL